ncbi:MAG: hypothetical protein U1F35_21250 [Steroidobacteraceae bacterium]
MPFALDCLARHWGVSDVSKARVYFIETDPSRPEVNGLPLISEAEFFGIDCSERLFNVAVNDSRLRQKVAASFRARGAAPLSLFSADSIVYEGNVIGEGAILSANSMVTVNSTIGKFFHANVFSYVAHDCAIGDFVTFAPRVSCNGNVHIHDHAYVGACAVIKQGTSRKPLVIGEGAVVGMGAVVTKDIPPHTTVVGIPARPVERVRR